MVVLDSSKLFHILKFLAPVTLFIWTLAYYTTSRDTYTEILRNFKDEKKLFVADFLENEIDGRLDGTKIAELCASRPWAPEDKAVILTCDNPPGGIGEVKNAHLHCIRFAIEIGAQLVLPRIIRRSDSDIGNLRAGQYKGLPLTYMFDLDHLVQSLTLYCPQMKIWSSLDDLYDVPTVLVPARVAFPLLTDKFVNGTILAEPEKIKAQFDDFIEKDKPKETRKYPIRVHLGETLFTWPVAYDGADFARNFGRILRTREDVKLLAASGLYNMRKRFNLNLDPRQGIRRESFVGVHLRTEKDVADKFPDYETQASSYLNYIAINKVPVVYLATGATDDHVKRFALRAKDFNATTVMKKDILEGAELALLNSFSWDQRALIDYEIMLRAGLITGTSDSSFMWNLAMRRKNAYEVFGQPWVLEVNENIMWQDKYSTIFGKSEKAPSMQYGIWP